jgi:hypothetical protein
MSSWLMRPERIPSYFALESEAEGDPAATSSWRRSGAAAPRARAAIDRVLQRFAHAKREARNRSAAAW